MYSTLVKAHTDSLARWSVHCEYWYVSLPLIVSDNYYHYDPAHAIDTALKGFFSMHVCFGLTNLNLLLV